MANCYIQISWCRLRSSQTKTQCKVVLSQTNSIKRRNLFFIMKKEQFKLVFKPALCRFKEINVKQRSFGTFFINEGFVNSLKRCWKVTNN